MYPLYIRLEWRVWSPHQFPIMNQSILYRLLRKVRDTTILLTPPPQGSVTPPEPGSWHNLALISEGVREEGAYTMLLSSLHPRCGG